MPKQKINRKRSRVQRRLAQLRADRPFYLAMAALVTLFWVIVNSKINPETKVKPLANSAVRRINATFSQGDGESCAVHAEEPISTHQAQCFYLQEMASQLGPKADCD